MRSNVRYFLFRYYENKTKSLALMGTASFCGGVRHKRYSVQQEDWFLKTLMILLLKKPPLVNPFITPTDFFSIPISKFLLCSFKMRSKK